MDQPVASKAREVSDHPALVAAARAGYAVSGLLHLLIGWIALQVALGGGSGGKSADQSGALQSLAGNDLGRVLLWLAVVGFAGLVLWQVADAAVGHSGSDKEAWGGRAKAVAKGSVYLVLAWSSFQFARGRSSESSEETVDLTAKLMAQPGGRLLVGVVGLVVIGVGAYHAHKGWTKRFLQDLEEHPGTWATRSGRLGYLAKGVALAIVGVLFVAAAVRKRAEEASGLDGALKALRDAPFGPWLLAAVAVGLAAYGLYSFSRAKHAKL
jgi:hypothetical protein